MKRFFLILIALLLASSAVTEGLTPSMFLGSRGMMVMDENQMNGMNPDSDIASYKEAFNGLNFCAYSVSESSNDSILFIYDGTLYAAFDMMSMFGGNSEGDTKTSSAQVFIDMCNAFDFDLLVFSVGEETKCIYGNTDAFIEAASQSEESTPEMIEQATDNMVSTKEEFTACITQYIGQ